METYLNKNENDLILLVGFIKLVTMSDGRIQSYGYDHDEILIRKNPVRSLDELTPVEKEYSLESDKLASDYKTLKSVCETEVLMIEKKIQELQKQIRLEKEKLYDSQKELWKTCDVSLKKLMSKLEFEGWETIYIQAEKQGKSFKEYLETLTSSQRRFLYYKATSKDVDNIYYTSGDGARYIHFRKSKEQKEYEISYIISQSHNFGKSLKY